MLAADSRVSEPAAHFLTYDVQGDQSCVERSDMSVVIQNCSRYLIDSRWFKQWKKYVGFDSWDMYNVGERSLFPGPVDNSGLFSGTVGILTFDSYAFACEDNAQLRLSVLK